MFLGCQERLGHLRHLENRVKETDSYCRFHCRLHPWFVKELSYILAERPPPSPWRNSIAPVLLCLKSQGWEQLQFPKEQAAPSLSPNPTQLSQPDTTTSKERRKIFNFTFGSWRAWWAWRSLHGGCTTCHCQRRVRDSKE